MPTAAQTLANAERRQQIAARYIQGEYQSSIAKALGVTQQRVSQELALIRKHWLVSALRDFDAIKSEQLAKVDAVEREAWAAWQRSQLPREVTLTEQVDGEKTSRKASVRREGQAGDPRFLERIQKCIDQRCAILGLSAETEAFKDAAVGLAAILEQAKLLATQPPPVRPPPSYAEA